MRSYCLLLGLLWLASCDPKPTARQEATAPPKTPAAPLVATPRPLALADTIPPYTTLPGFGDSAQAAPRVRINGALYRVQITARTDSTRPLRHTAPPTEYLDGSVDDSTQTPSVTGFEGTYTFRLLRADGKMQFVKTLQKSDFADEVGKDLVVEANAVRPVFSGYLPAFNALAFELSFYPESSDNGGEALLLLDAATGRVIHKQLSHWMSGCNSPTALSPNGRALLTSTEILQANGRSTEIDNKPGREVAGTLLVNNQTVLVAYVGGYDNKGDQLPLKGPNSILMDLNGRKLAAFNLESLDSGLGSRMLAKYVGQTRSHYLYDEANGKVGVISTDKPAPPRVLKLSQAPTFRAPQQPTEVRIHFNTETGTEATFYVDTVSGNLRQRVRKPSY